MGKKLEPVYFRSIIQSAIGLFNSICFCVSFQITHGFVHSKFLIGGNSMGTHALPLPIPAAQLLPHQQAMCCIDSLLTCGPDSAQALVHLKDGYIFLNNGILERAAYIELAAQTAGAMQGYLALHSKEQISSGYLVGAQDFTFFADAFAQQTLLITVAAVSAFQNICLVEASIQAEGTLLAQGLLKVFIPSNTFSPGV